MSTKKQDEVQIKFNRVKDFDLATSIKKKTSDLTRDERAEVVRALILCGVKYSASVPVHVNFPTPDFLFFREVFFDMVNDPENTDEFRTALMKYGDITTLADRPHPDLVAKFAE